MQKLGTDESAQRYALLSDPKGETRRMATRSTSNSARPHKPAEVSAYSDAVADTAMDVIYESRRILAGTPTNGSGDDQTG